MATGTIAQPPITGTSNGWTYLRVGNNVIAWYYKQFTSVDVNTAWAATGIYISSTLQAAPYPSFLKSGYKFCASLAGGAQDAGIGLGRVMDNNSAIRVFLASPQARTGVDCAIMVMAFGEWK